MPDIAMCKNEECPKKETCYRYKATPCCYQTYSNFKYEKDIGCKWFWNTEVEDWLI